MTTDHRANLLTMFRAALDAVDGRARVRDALERNIPSGTVYVLAVGKAACAMAQGAHDALGKRIVDALIITKHGHAESLPWPVLEAGHPLVDASSVEAGRRVLAYADQIPASATVVVLISGGASALMEALPPQVDFERFQEINRWIQGSGLDITDYNRIRRRLSRLKGGRLAKILAPRNILGLVISDVPGDELRAIGSGPLTPDPDLGKPLGLPGLPRILEEALPHVPPAPLPEDDCFRHVHQEIVATLEDAKRAAAAAALRFGYRAIVHPEFIRGEAAQVGARLAQQLLRSEHGVVQVWGGETTVRLPSTAGRGGRNQSLALAAAQPLAGKHHVWLLAAGTDGTDGPTDDAGALVDGESLARGAAAGLESGYALANADAGTYLEATGDLIQTGPTGTNVMDIVLGLKAAEGG